MGSGEAGVRGHRIPRLEWRRHGSGATPGARVRRPGHLGGSGAAGPRAGRSFGQVGIVYGGPSPEHDVSILTGLQAVRCLSGRTDIGDVLSLYWSKEGEWFEVEPGLEPSAFVNGPPSEGRPLRLSVGGGGGFSRRRGGRFGGKDEPLELDALVICCHGGPGEDGTLQGVFDLIGLPYTGPTPAGALLGMDKLVFGALAASASLKTLPRVPLYEGSGRPGFEGPFIVKPRFGGSSIGIEVVTDYETACARLRINPHLRRGAVLEPYRPELFDLQLAVRTWPDTQLSAIERPLRSHPGGEILAYNDKYVGPEGMTTAPREMPALVGAPLEKQIREAALELAALAGLRGIARVDFLSDGETAYVNEVNTIPGSLGRHLWIEPPIEFADPPSRSARRGGRPAGRQLLGRRRRRFPSPRGRLDQQQARLSARSPPRTGIALVGFSRKLLAPGEAIVLESHPNWSILVPRGVFAAAVVAGCVAVVVSWSAAPLWVGYILLAAGLLALAGVLAKIVTWRSTTLVITNARVIYRTGALRRLGREIPLSRVQDVTYRQSVLERMLGAGSLTVESAGQSGQQAFPDVAHPAMIQSLINSLMFGRRRRGRWVERADRDRTVDLPGAAAPGRSSSRRRSPVRAGNRPPIGRRASQASRRSRSTAYRPMVTRRRRLTSRRDTVPRLRARAIRCRRHGRPGGSPLRRRSSHRGGWERRETGWLPRARRKGHDRAAISSPVSLSCTASASLPIPSSPTSVASCWAASEGRSRRLPSGPRPGLTPTRRTASIRHMPTASRDGLNLYFETHGDSGAPPVLLVAGLGMQLVDWPPQWLDRLVEEGFFVIAFDNRDVGLSTHLDSEPPPDLAAIAGGSRPKVAYYLGEMADDAIAVLDALEIGTAHVVGVSMGGMIAQQIAIAHPGRVRSLCSIMSTTGDGRVGQPTPEVVGQLLAPPPPTREQSIDRSVAISRLIGSPGLAQDEATVRAAAGLSYDRSHDPDGVARQLVAIVMSPDRTGGLAQCPACRRS